MIRSELTLRIPNSPGALAGICHLLSSERVNIVALLLEPNGRLHLIVDNPTRAVGVLEAQHHGATQSDVLFVTVPNTPGGVAPVMSLIADAGVNVNYAYAAGGEGSSSAALVLGVDDPLRASAAVGT